MQLETSNAIRGIVLAEPRSPIAVREADLASAHCVVAMKEAEHRPVIAAGFPGWTERIVYWNVHDIADGPPAVALRNIEDRVGALIAALLRDQDTPPRRDKVS